VKNAPDREYYLGHSVKASAGRWQKGAASFSLHSTPYCCIVGPKLEEGTATKECIFEMEAELRVEGDAHARRPPPRSWVLACQETSA